jgi:MFS family permease
MLVASYGVAQALISWAFGRIVDLHGYAPLTLVAALTPLAACAVLVVRGVDYGHYPCATEDPGRSVE